MTQRRGYTRRGAVDLRRLPTIIRRPLGRERAYGFANHLQHGSAGGDPPDREWDGSPTVWLDPTYDGTRKGLEVALHEALHLSCPFLYEEVVTATARYQAQLLWHLGYRLVPRDERDS